MHVVQTHYLSLIYSPIFGFKTSMGLIFFSTPPNFQGGIAKFHVDVFPDTSVLEAQEATRSTHVCCKGIGKKPGLAVQISGGKMSDNQRVSGAEF